MSNRARRAVPVLILAAFACPTRPARAQSPPPDQQALEAELARRNDERRKGFEAEARAAQAEMDVSIGRARQEQAERSARDAALRERADEQERLVKSANTKATIAQIGGGIALGVAGITLIGTAVAASNGAQQDSAFRGIHHPFLSAADQQAAYDSGQAANGAAIGCAVASVVLLAIGVPTLVLWSRPRPARIEPFTQDTVWPRPAPLWPPFSSGEAR